MFSLISLSTLALRSAFSCGECEQRGFVVFMSRAERRWRVELDSSGFEGSKMVGMSRADLTAQYRFMLCAEPSLFGEYEWILSAEVDWMLLRFVRFLV